MFQQFIARSLCVAVFLTTANGAFAFPISKILKQQSPLTKKFNFLDADELPESLTNNYDFEGIVKLDNCSGSLVRFENSKATDKAIVLSNGHCVSAGLFGGFINPGEFYANKNVSRDFDFLNSDSTLSDNSTHSSRLLYATMTGTDISLYELDDTYAQIEESAHVKALTLDAKIAGLDTAIEILSGYWQRGYACSIDRVVNELNEGGYVQKDSIRYSQPGCEIIHGTSGSPIINSSTRKIIGINNTANDNGEKCTMDNPCEVAKDGTIFFEKGKSYGQQTFQIYSCLNSGGKFDLATPGCKLLGAKPALRKSSIF